MRTKAEWVWALSAVIIGTTVLFLAVFFLALETWRLVKIPYAHQ